MNNDNDLNLHSIIGIDLTKTKPLTDDQVFHDKFSMVSFHVASFICSSVHANLPVFSMTSTIVKS